MTHPYRSRTDPKTGEEYLPVRCRGRELLEDPLYNKGTAWPIAEREALGLLGLLPPHQSSEHEQTERILGVFHGKRTDLDRFLFLQGLHDRNEVLFYQALIGCPDEMLPIVYTPTVGEACKNFHHLFRRPRGMYVTADTAGKTAEMLSAVADWAHIEVAVVTDGSRILGLGDLGANGMGIPIGKLSLYVAAGGFHPAETQPILLDVGTDNDELREHPRYLGSRSPRLRGDDYDQVVAAFVAGFREACPDALLQFEDFSRVNAFRLLDRYRDDGPVFNDDIQGTGAVTTAALLSSARRTGIDVAEQRVLLVGAGGAGVGISRALAAAGVARENIFLRDSRSVVTTDRERPDPIKAEFAQDRARLQALGLDDPAAPLAEVVARLAPTALVGTTGQHGLFDEAVVRAAAGATAVPMILPLSNPTDSSEADPQQVTDWSDGRALVATGSPFPEVKHDGHRRHVSQCNNLLVFPGVGLGVKLIGARRVTDAMFTAAARALADCVDDKDLADGQLLPPITAIRDVSARVAAAVATQAATDGVASRACPDDPAAAAAAAMWVPRYLPFRYEPDA